MYKAKDEFKVGNHKIGYINDRFLEAYKDTEFEKRPTPTFQKLPRAMKDTEIEYELKCGYCSLGDILSFLDNATEECKDGWANIFYTPEFVVGVCWDGGYWSVGTWRRLDGVWYGRSRVFSPAIESSSTQSSNPSALGHSCPNCGAKLKIESTLSIIK